MFRMCHPDNDGEDTRTLRHTGSRQTEGRSGVETIDVTTLRDESEGDTHVSDNLRHTSHGSVLWSNDYCGST